MRHKPQNEPQKKKITWRQLKDASEDLQKEMDLSPAITISTQCSDEKLNTWIREAITLVESSDTLKPATLKTLEDAYNFVMPVPEEELTNKFISKFEEEDLDEIYGTALPGIEEDSDNKFISSSEQEPHKNSPLRQHKPKRTTIPTPGITDKDREFFRELADRGPDPGSGEVLPNKLIRQPEEEPEPEPEPVKERPVKDEPSLARIRVSRHKLGRHIARGGGRGGRGRPSSGNIFTSS